MALQHHSTFDADEGPTTPVMPPVPVESAFLLEAAWSSIITDPLTVSGDGRTIWANDQIAKFFHGDQATGAQYSGTDWQGLYPREWIEERLAIMKQIKETGRPLLLRTIWRGYQQLSWMHYIPDDDEGKADHFLVITRRIGCADSNQIEAMSRGANMVESKIASLGELASLTTRELEVLALLGQGLSIKEIASTLHRSAKTVENHRSSIGRKLQLDDRVQLAELARRAGLTPKDAARKRV